MDNVEENVGVTPTEEVVTEEQVETVEAPVEEVQPETQEKETIGQIRFKQLREGRKKAEQERDKLREELQALREAQTAPMYQQPRQEQEKLDDDLVEVKDLRAVKQEMAKYRDDAKIAALYPDFHDVVSEENAAILQKVDPEAYETIKSSSSYYNKSVTAYKTIKYLGIHKPVQSDDGIRADQNLAKPRPIAAAGTQKTADSPLAHANAFATALTKDRKAQVFAEMRRNQGKT